MSYAVMRAMKFKGGSGLSGIQIHNRREKDHSNTNPDYDPSKSHLNYSLVESPSDKSFNQLVEERLSAGYKGKIVKGEMKPTAIRKDAVKMVEILFASDKAFFDTLTSSEQQKYFEDCLNWAKKRFGAENIFSAVVHVEDEHRDGSPHMHLDFVPLTVNGELSANKILGGRVDLQKMQDDFWNTVGKPWGLERGERADLADENAPKSRKHKTDKEFKAEKAQEHAEKQLKLTIEACIEVNRELYESGDKNALIKKENENISIDTENKLIRAREIQSRLNDLTEQERLLNERIAALRSKEEEMMKNAVDSYKFKIRKDFEKCTTTENNELFNNYQKAYRNWLENFFISDEAKRIEVFPECMDKLCYNILEKGIKFLNAIGKQNQEILYYAKADENKIREIYQKLIKQMPEHRFKLNLDEHTRFIEKLKENKIHFMYKIDGDERCFIVSQKDEPLLYKIYNELKNPKEQDNKKGDERYFYRGR